MARLVQSAGATPNGLPEMAGRLVYRLFHAFTRVFSILLLLATWEILARSGAFTHFQLPALSDVLERIWSDGVSGDLWINTALTLYRALTAFVICVVFDAIFPVVTATLAGIAAVEKELLWSARNMGANERQLTWQIVLPAASPQILTGLQVALPIALIVEIIAEMVMGGYGLGGAMMGASRFANSPGVFAGIVEIAVVGFVLIKALAMIRRRLLVWHQETAEPAGT